MQQKTYALVVLTLVYAMNFVDRGLVILLLQPIKEELHLSDTQLGFVTGVAFGLFYALLGLPIARRADRGDRSLIAALAIGLWGVTVMSTLFVTNFVQLVCARVAAAVGEAGCMPPTYSLLGDIFPESAERVRAVSVYMLAGPLSALVSFVGGSLLSARYGWRVAFFVAGVPGLLLAGIVRWTIKDSRSHARMPRRRLPDMSLVLRDLWRQRSSRHLSIAIILLFAMGYGLAPWYAAFMMRSHGMDGRELGAWFGMIFGIGGVAGVLLGGYVTQRWCAADEKRQLRLIGLMVALEVPLYVLFLLLPQRSLSVLALVLLTLVANFFFGPTFALMQRLVINETRATALAVVMLLVNLVGMGLGPQVVGILSDLFRPTLGVDSLRYAMLVMALVGLWAAYHFWSVGKTVKEDLTAIALQEEVNLSSE